MANGDIYRLALEAIDGYGSTVVNVLNYRQELDGPLNTGAQDLAEAFEAAFATGYAGLTVNGCSAKKIVVRNRTVPTEGWEIAIDVAGAASGEGMPPADTVIAQLKTGLIGRSFRGEYNMAGVPQVANESGQVLAAFKTQLIDFIEDIMALGTLIITGTFVLGVWSQTLSEFHPVTSVIVSDDFGHLKSRRPGVGS